MITLRKPLTYSFIGEKPRQEDAVWPREGKATSESPCVVLCDGVGGSDHGEVASWVVSAVVGEFLTNRQKLKSHITESDVQDAVRQAYDELEKIDTKRDDGSISMATTLACVCISDNGVYAAHMGDSRIYQIRPNYGMLYQSADHSLANMLLERGEITVEQARNFPQKGVITRAIQPYGNTRYEAEVLHLTNIESGDYFFICSDGVLEHLTSRRLLEILSMSICDEDKLKLLKEESVNITKDNYSAYLIPIDTITHKKNISDRNEVRIISAQRNNP